MKKYTLLVSMAFIFSQTVFCQVDYKFKYNGIDGNNNLDDFKELMTKQVFLKMRDEGSLKNIYMGKNLSYSFLIIPQIGDDDKVKQIIIIYTLSENTTLEKIDLYENIENSLIESYGEPSSSFFRNLKRSYPTDYRDRLEMGIDNNQLNANGNPIMFSTWEDKTNKSILALEMHKNGITIKYIYYYMYY
jgi:hypothetical protein